MNIKQILNAKDWFFVATVPNGTEEQLLVFYLAAWALLESGKVIGLISVADSAAFEEGDKTPRLVSVPPGANGTYKPKDELSAHEQEALKKDGVLTPQKMECVAAYP